MRTEEPPLQPHPCTHPPTPSTHIHRTCSLTPSLVLRRILDAIRKRIKNDAELREERKNFTIEDSSSLPNMQVVESPVAQDPFLP